MDYKIVSHDKFQVIGVKKVFSYDQGKNLEDIPKFWDEVHTNGTIEQLGKLGTSYMGICSVSKEQEANQEMDYWIATEYNGQNADGMEIFEVSAQQWAIFKSVGALPEAIQATWQQIFSKWLPDESDYVHANGPEIEVYDGSDTTKSDFTCEVWIPVTKK
ncbi:GyrI-like domain-containing protein [Listeria booriae]|uniref:GyrI-like domain-containing protein n=1 Tax=Listeria booriae TaxID=1552123 RepID=UPI00162661D1|nr:GyrI-like domain-containing protein [Listeria booriae]MBC2259762.1 AraC family transcriptional regulator [Listeria booriae]